MRSSNRFIILPVLGLIISCFIAVIVFTQSSFTEQFNLSSTVKSNIGTTIGGITAPIIGVFSSILLYLALSRQTDSNIEQQIKNESDVIFLLINQLENEVTSFYTKETHTNILKDGTRQSIDKKFTGIEALNDYCRHYRYDDTFTNLNDITFKNWYESGQIMLFIDTFNLVQERISISNLSLGMQNLFNSKLKSFYNYRLKIPLTSLSEAFELYPQQKDDYSNKLQEFVNRML